MEWKHQNGFSLSELIFKITFSQIIFRSQTEKTSLIINLDPYRYTEFVTICLSLKELLRKNLVRKLLGTRRRVFNLSRRQELYLASLWVQMGVCATDTSLSSVPEWSESFLVGKLRANGLDP